MAKEGLDISTIQSVLKDVKETSGWSLCIGAGTSCPVLPGWISLVDNMIRRHCDSKDIIDINTYEKMGFSADAMIQAVRNRLDVNDDEFIKMLSEEIYSPIRDNLSKSDWNVFIKVHESRAIASIKERDWDIFREQIIDKLLKKTSANLLAPVVVKSISTNIAPRAILTFNGEAIFLSLLNYYSYQENPDDKKMKFEKVVNAMVTRHTNRIPYIHCHGVLPINGVKKRRGFNANDKLVFLEEKYLQLANSPMSWQAISFIENCMNSKMVFVGVSLTDANMRRWLGFIHSNKMQEFRGNGLDCNNATEHFWINKKPKTDVEKTWIEESVSHLGVRLVWIDEWSQVGEVLKRMLGLS